MLDYLIRGGTLVDGTGSPGVKGDLGVRDGRIVAVGGTITEDAAETLDADGLVVSPGFVDVHTHYDAQLFWDPYATPSNVHGVTTVLGGNCGFTLAPLHAKDADYLRRMMAKVEGMPLVALETGVDWKWETFGDYLDLLDGKIGLNAAFLVGHCALRRYVMGEDAIGNEATPEQIDEMVRVLHASIEAGAIGFSTTLSSTHSDGDGKPVASRWATKDELIALCKATGEHEGTLLEGIVQGCLDKFADDEIELLADMSAAAGRPLNWNVLTIDGRTPEKVVHQLKASDPGPREGRPGRRADHADPRPDEHEPAHLLRAEPDPRLGRRSSACRSPSASPRSRTRRPAPRCCARPTAPRPASSAGSPTSAATSSATPSPPRTRA